MLIRVGVNMAASLQDRPVSDLLGLHVELLDALRESTPSAASF